MGRDAAVWGLVSALALGCNFDPRDEEAGAGLTGASGPAPSSTGSAGDDAAPGAGTDDGAPGGDDTDAPGDSGAKFDLGEPAGEDTGSPCELSDGFEFSYIWIANSPSGTVSKIDTVTTQEVGRYATGTGTPNPSRTSVNLHGDVAVVNRGKGEEPNATLGGVVKIAARLEDCVDDNGDGVIQTSTGGDDVLPWGSDECVLWSDTIDARDGTDQEWNEGPRPVAWEPALEEDSCDIGENPRLWVAWYDGASEEAVVRRLDGATGQVLDELHVPGWGNHTWGPYGGAVNRDGDFWVIGHGATGKVLRVDADDMSYDLIDNPGPDYSFYGLALDADGQLWIGGRNGRISNYDPQTQAWTDVGMMGGVMRGVAVDREGRAWVAGNGPCRLIEIDTASKTVTNANVIIPGCSLPVGVSVDVEGYVWIVDEWASKAFKMDPDTYAITASPADLDSPYTYSDMTGAGLSLVAHPPAG